MTTTPQKLDINPKFEALLRPLDPDERDRLEWSILREGILDPLKVWLYEDKHYIVDGHNRYKIYNDYPTEIQELGGYHVKYLTFPSEDEAMEWILENQLRRRNLTYNEKVLCLGRLFEMRKKRRGRQAGNGQDPSGSTAELIAAEQDVSPRTVTRAAEVVAAYDSASIEMQNRFARGEVSQTELLQQLKKHEEPTSRKKDRLHNDVTEAFKTCGERIKRTIQTLRSQGTDFLEIAKAAKVEGIRLAPALAHLEDHLKREEKQAELLTTLVYVGELCPNQTAGQCGVCKSVEYITEIEFKALKTHFLGTSSGDSS